MGPARMNTAFDSFNEIATVRIELRHTDPVIWRQVEVPTSITLKVLHRIIQAAMGWFDYHLWEFTIDERQYGLPMDEDWGTEPRTDASQGTLARRAEATQDHLRLSLRLRRLLGAPAYSHRLRAAIPSLLPPVLRRRTQRAARGLRRHSRLLRMLDAAADPKHPNHAEAKEWPDDYDPNIVDELPIKYALGRIANRRNAAKARLANKK